MLKIGTGILSISCNNFICKTRVKYEIYFLGGVGILMDLNLNFMELLKEDELNFFDIKEYENKFDFANFLENFENEFDIPVWSIIDEKNIIIFESNFI